MTGYGHTQTTAINILRPSVYIYIYIYIYITWNVLVPVLRPILKYSQNILVRTFPVNTDIVLCVYMHVFVCVCVCVRARARVCVCLYPHTVMLV